MSTAKSKRITVGKQVHLPLSKAFAISMNSIRIRFGRSMITAGGTFLGIAFLVSVLTSSFIEQHLPGTMDPVALQAAKNRQLWLVIMSLLVCTVGITNSMLMSVTERFREIGTMKCLGALDFFIVEMFLFESGILGVIASLAGCIVGFGSIWLLALAQHGWAIAGQITAAQIGLCVGIGTAVGSVLTVIATIPPAIRAAKMPPAMALRTSI